MTNEESQKPNVIDIATMLTVGGILLYSLGWIYWNNFFKTLHIETSFIDIPFERVIVTTWFFVIMVLVGFILTFNHLIESKSQNKFDVASAGYFLISSIFLFLYQVSFNSLWLITLIVALVLYSLIIYFLSKIKINIGIVSKAWFKYILIIVIYISSVYFYFDKSKKDADNFFYNYQENIELTINKDNSIITGKFIVLMKNKYFILVKKDKRTDIIIINDSEVLQARMK